MKAHLRHARISPKKANLVAGMVRNLPVNEATSVLERLPKKGALVLKKLIDSAAANAENNANQKRSDLYIKTLIVNKGPGFRRFIPIARGRARPIDKFTSHISVELGVVIPEGAEGEKGSKAARQQKKEEKKTQEAQEKKSEVAKKEVQEKAEYSASKPMNAPQQKSGDVDEDSDPHAGGSKDTQAGSTFTPHRQGSRGS